MHFNQVHSPVKGPWTTNKVCGASRNLGCLGRSSEYQLLFYLLSLLVLVFPSQPGRFWVWITWALGFFCAAFACSSHVQVGSLWRLNLPLTLQRRAFGGAWIPPWSGSSLPLRYETSLVQFALKWFQHAAEILNSVFVIKVFFQFIQSWFWPVQSIFH